MLPKTPAKKKKTKTKTKQTRNQKNSELNNDGVMDFFQSQLKTTKGDSIILKL